MIVYDFKERFNIKIRDLNYDLDNLYKYNRRINNQYSVDSNSITIVQQRFDLIEINSVLNYQNGLLDNDINGNIIELEFVDDVSDLWKF